MCLVEMCGPSRFSHFDPDVRGGVVGQEHEDAWVQVAATAKDQTKNTMTVFPALISDKLKQTYGLEIGREVIRAFEGRRRLEAVTSNYRSLEGARSTFVVLNETHHWVKGNGGHDMYVTVDGNATKMDGRYIAITNAFVPGEDSVAERMRDFFEKVELGEVEEETHNIGFLYDSVEAHEQTPLTPEALRIVVPKIRGDAFWLRVETIIKSVLNGTLSPSRSRRVWLNQIVAGEDAIYDRAHWAAIARRGEMLKLGEPITLGFDGGLTDDNTALIAIRTTDQVAFLLHHQYKPDGPKGEGWHVDFQSADRAVENAFEAYNVKGFYCDVYGWESYITKWVDLFGEKVVVKAEGRNPIAWDMRRSIQRNVYAHERLMRAVFDEQIGYDDDDGKLIRRHALNAYRDEDNNYGVYFQKESPQSQRKVDIYAALMLAHECLYDLRTRVKKEVPADNTGYFL